MTYAKYWVAIAVCVVLALGAAACDDREDPEKSWGHDTAGPGGDATETVIHYDGVKGTWGDITIAFVLRPPDDEPRSVTVDYKGACAGDEWTPAEVSGDENHPDLAALKPGRYEFVWHSWETEAGCAGDVYLRLITHLGEGSVSDAIPIDNTQPGETGFADYPQIDQGINPWEMQAFERSLDALLPDPSVDFVATRVDDEYQVWAARGFVAFTRTPTHKGYEYDIVDVDGENPIGRQDPTWGSTLDDELALGSNPNNAAWPDEGYPAGDPRLSFIEPEDDSYPFGYERIAAYFDSPNAADFYINWLGYAHSVLEVGEHGSLNIEQSRSPLLMWGAGITPGRVDDDVRQVDIAPTVGALLGFEKTEGIDERGVYSKEVYLPLQDGHVIQTALSGTGAGHVIIIVMDGLTHTEILDQVTRRPSELPNFARFYDEGAWAGYGSISNWPSVTYPGHNVIGSGMYSGHHGIIDNEFYVRPTASYKEPINKLFFSEGLFDPIYPGETLHEATHRNFGKYKPKAAKGALTAALADPSTHGADKADLEFRDKTGQIPFPPLGLYWPPEIPGPNPSMRHAKTTATQLLEKLTMVELWHLLFDDGIPQPTYVVMNFATTDESGHQNGPHGPQMEKVLDHIDKNLGLIFAWLDAAGIADETTLIITSDHGMQISDPTRGAWPIDSLDAAGIKRAADTYLSVYLKVPRAYFSPAQAPEGVETNFTVTVQDDDLGTAIAGATVTATDNDETVEAVTDAEGRAAFTLTPDADLTVTVERDDYTSTDFTVPLN